MSTQFQFSNMFCPVCASLSNVTDRLDLYMDSNDEERISQLERSGYSQSDNFKGVYVCDTFGHVLAISDDGITLESLDEVRVFGGGFNPIPGGLFKIPA